MPADRLGAAVDHQRSACWPSPSALSSTKSACLPADVKPSLSSCQLPLHVHQCPRFTAACLQITAAVEPQRDRLDACLVFPSMPAVMKLNKLGAFDFAKLMGNRSGDKKKDSPLKKFFGAVKKGNDNFEEQLLKLVSCPWLWGAALITRAFTFKVG